MLVRWLGINGSRIILVVTRRCGARGKVNRRGRRRVNCVVKV